MDASLQRLYENGFIKELKEDQWELQQDAQQPKAGQLWDLPQTHNTHFNLPTTQEVSTATVSLGPAETSHLFLEVPGVTEIESDGLD